MSVKKIGRPPKEQELKNNAKIQIYLNPHELAESKALADESNVSISLFCRSLLKKAIYQKQKEIENASKK